MSGGMITANVSGKADVVLTTKGDIVTYDTSRIRKAVGNNSATLFSDSSEASGNKWDYPTTSFVVACSSEGDDLTTGDDKLQFRLPFQFELTDIIANVNSAPTGSAIHVMVQEDDVDIMSGNGIEIDVSETTSEDATTQPTITDSTLAFNSIISVDLDQVGSTNAGTGLKINFIGYRVI
tara:strand:+ start:280 stop:816 length:537 start_codon:yes stop_codon:yes gene_type:complete